MIRTIAEGSHLPLHWRGGVGRGQQGSCSGRDGGERRHGDKRAADRRAVWPILTHTAHPHVLARLGEIATDVLGSAMRVHNASAFETKTEVVRRLHSLGMADVVPETHSCWIARQDAHCGKCVPCLVRRFAVTTAGLRDVAYGRDLFAAPWNRADPNNKDLADYMAFVKTIRESNDVEMVIRFAELGIPGGAVARGTRSPCTGAGLVTSSMCCRTNPTWRAWSREIYRGRPAWSNRQPRTHDLPPPLNARLWRQ